MGISISINLIPYFTYDFLSIIELLSPFKMKVQSICQLIFFSSIFTVFIKIV